MRDDWTETTIGDVAEASWGNTTVTKKQYKESGFTAFSASGPDGFVDWFEHDEKGVVLSAIGALCGKTWLAEGKWTPIKNTIWFKSKSKECLTDYLFLVSKTPDLWPIRGQAQPFISLGDVRLVELSMPPLAEQKRIVDVVSSVDAYIDALQQRAETSRTARNAVLHELLSAGGDDWTETTLGEVVVINPEAARGMADDDEIVYVDLSSVSAESGISSDLYRGSFGEAPGRARRVIRTQDVLVSTVRPYLRGFALVPDFLDGEIASTGFAVLRAKPSRILPGLVWAIVGTNNFVDYLMDRATGSSYPAVRPDDVASFNFSLPPLVEQKRIVEIVSSTDDVIQLTEQAVTDAKILRSGLLSDLLSGEHEIPASYDSLLGAA